MLPFITLLVYLISKKGIPLFTESQRSVDKLSALSARISQAYAL